MAINIEERAKADGFDDVLLWMTKNQRLLVSEVKASTPHTELDVTVINLAHYEHILNTIANVYSTNENDWGFTTIGHYAKLKKGTMAKTSLLLFNLDQQRIDNLRRALDNLEKEYTVYH